MRDNNLINNMYNTRFFISLNRILHIFGQMYKKTLKLPNFVNS